MSLRLAQDGPIIYFRLQLPHLLSVGSQQVKVRAYRIVMDWELSVNQHRPEVPQE